MHAEQNDVMFGVMTLIIYAVQEVLSANGFTIALLALALALAGGGDLGIADAALYWFTAVMIVWALTFGFLSGRTVKVALEAKTGGPSVTCSCVISRPGSRCPSRAAPSVSLTVTRFVGVTAVVMWFWLRLPVWCLIIAYLRIGWRWLRELVARRAM